MSEGEELRGMWEFAATWKLLSLLSVPLSFTPPTVTQLETALLSPVENISLLADVHGRLLGLSSGNTAAKKWMQSAARFIRTRIEEFSFLLEDPLQSRRAKMESTIEHVKEEPQHVEAEEDEETTNEHEDDALTAERPFPRHEDTYFRLKPSTRLLTLHTIAEIVLSEHDTLLCAGSIMDIDLEEMRIHSFASDANGNNYWYFGDSERVYREPGQVSFKTRLQKAEDDAKAAEKARREAAVEEARLAREAKKIEAQRKQEEVKRRREERKRKQMEKWGPRVAATRATRASRRAEAQAFLESREEPEDDQQDMNGTVEAEDENSDRRPRRSSMREKKAAAGPSTQSTDTNETTPRRTSGRRRKSAQEVEAPAASTRTAKRPRKASSFTDPELRICNGWEVTAQGADSLQNLINRFRPEDEGVLAAEKPLVRRLEENVMPIFLEKEEQERKELEKEEKRRRAELLLTSFTKRSSRVQARAQRREEEAKRIAEEEEQERQRQEKIARRAEVVKAQVVSLEKEQSRDIRNARRAHGRTDAIERDDEIQKVLDRKSARRDRADGEMGLRRSTRAHRASRRLMETEEDNFEEVKQSDEMEGVEEDDTDAKDTLVKENNEEIDANEPNATVITEEVKEEERGAGTIQYEDVESKLFERSVGSSFTWSLNPDDGEPIRVLDKFFFADEGDFSDAPLETCEQRTGVVGFGILLPPTESFTDARRVRIGDFEEWVIEYGDDARMWVKTKSAWYELREPAVEYREAYKSARQKYELCIRISILGETMKSSQLTYDAMVELLGYRYEDMMAYSENDILEEKRFIVSQMQALNKRAMMSSSFMKELLKKIKAEDAKVEAEIHREEAKPDDPKSTKKADVEKTNDDTKKTNVEETRAKPLHKKPTRRRSSATGQPVVPRAVSSIVNALLKTATKSANPPRKRKRKLDVAQGAGEMSDVRKKKIARAGSGLNGVTSTPSGLESRKGTEDQKMGIGKPVSHGNDSAPMYQNGIMLLASQIESPVREEKVHSAPAHAENENGARAEAMGGSASAANERGFVRPEQSKDRMEIDRTHLEGQSINNQVLPKTQPTEEVAKVAAASIPQPGQGLKIERSGMDASNPSNGTLE